jgi:stage IV sporulation protein FB
MPPGQDFAGHAIRHPGLARGGFFTYPEAHMFRFSVFGIPVEVQPFFWITLVILGGASGADSASAIFEIVLFVLAGFISILVHELGHALTARRYGANVGIVLQAFGGYAAYSGVRMSRKQSFLITAAGPAIQIALGAAVLGLLLALPEMNNHGEYFLHILAFISFAWAIINLLPVLPLDGGQMLNALLGPSRIRTTLWTSVIVASGVAALIILRDPGNFIFAIFLGMFAWQAYQALQENKWR